MRFKKTVATSLVVAALSVSLVFKAGCGGGFLGLEDYQRDLLGFGGLAAAILFGPNAPADEGDGGAGNPVPGPQGDAGPAGQSGGDGSNCWDTNGNGLADLDTEDLNGDGAVDVRDCLGEQGADGAPGTAGDPATGNGLNCWDLNGNGLADVASEDVNGDGVVDVLDCRGADGSDGSSGSDGAAGSSGGPGVDGADGVAGPTDFTVFIDDFFTLGGSPTGNLPIDVVSIREPALGGTGLNPEQDVRIAYRVAIPQTYRTGKPVTMRMFFDVTGTGTGSCMEMTVTTARLRHGSSVERGPQRWVRLSPEQGNGSPDSRGDLGGRTTLVADLPINVGLANGLEFWMDAGGCAGLNGIPDGVGLDIAQFLAFELETTTFDGRTYHLVGVEFFSSNAAAVVNAEIFSAEPCPCGDKADAANHAYISGTDSDNVFVLDIASAALTAVVEVGNGPRGIDITPDNSRVYVANREDGSLSVIDTATNMLLQTIELEGDDLVSATEPYDLVVSPDGEWLYVAMKNGGSENGDGTVVVVDLPCGNVVAEAILDDSASLEGIVVTPNGQTVYAAGRGAMYIVDVSTPSSPVFKGTRGDAARELVVSPDGAFVYAENNAVRTSDNVAIPTGDFSGERGVAISPDGRFLYSTDERTFVRVVEITEVDGLPVTTFVENIDDAGNLQFDSYGIDLTDGGGLGVVSYANSDSVRIFRPALREFVGPPIPLEFTDCLGTTIFGDEPKQLVIGHGEDVGDPCDLTSPKDADCNENNLIDGCEIEDGRADDCNGNGVPDECDSPKSLEGVWRFAFSVDNVCDLFQVFFREVRYLRFDASGQLVENWIEVDQGEGCINFPYPSVDQPNLISYRFFFGLVTNDTSRQILSSEVNGVCGTFGFTEQVQVGRTCDGEDGVTDVSGSFIDDNNLAGSWEFQTSPDSIDDGLNCNPNTLERVCGSFDAVRVDGPPDCFIVNGCDDCNSNGICDDIEITSSVFLTTLDSATGAPIGTFSVGLVPGQFVPFIKVDASANIWVGRKNTSHGLNEPSPDDMVAQFTSTGTPLQTVKGPMHDPRSLAVDSLGNIYVGGSPDGGSLIVSRIYKYDSNGVFLMSFGELTGAALGAGYTALEFAPGDRLYATTGNPHRVYEYTTAGAQVRVVGSFDGAARRGSGLALSPDGLSLWNYQTRNGPGEDFIIQYDLNLTILSSFGMNSLGDPFLLGLDTLPSGNLVARSGSKIIEISPTGTLIREIDFSAIDGGGSLRRGFAVDNSGNYLVNHAGLDVSDCDHNNTLDECDISANPSLDGNSNGILDSCEDD